MADERTLRQAFDAHRMTIASTGSASTKASKARTMNLLQRVLTEDMSLRCPHFFSPDHAVSVKERLRAAFTKGTFGRAEASVKQRVSQLRMTFIGMGASEAWINTVFLLRANSTASSRSNPALQCCTPSTTFTACCVGCSAFYTVNRPYTMPPIGVHQVSPSGRVLTRNLAALSIIVLFGRRRVPSYT